MDVLRAYAYLDLLNGVTAETRIAGAEAQDEAAEAAEALAWANARAAGERTGPKRGGREATAAWRTTRAEPGARADAGRCPLGAGAPDSCVAP